MNPVIVRVPGSTSNCGAGFDTLGLALGIFNEVLLTPGNEPGAVPARESDARARGLVDEVVAVFATCTALPVVGFSYRIEGEVPPARGLGSSVTVLAGVLAGLNHWAGNPLTRERMAALITKIEGHPDNATAGVLGGFCVARCTPTPADFVDLVRVEIPSHLRFVVVSPAVEVATKASRGILPERIDHLDAVRSVNSAAYFTAALVSGDYARLRGAVEDFLHEPYRLPGIAGAKEAILAGVDAGGLTGWLSGSGSSVLCLAEAECSGAVGAAMTGAFSALGVRSDVRVLRADNSGLLVRDA